MKLRTRLLVFSSAFLIILPLSANYFIEKIERSLLQGQEEAQKMTASAIATVVRSYTDLFDIDEDALYVYPKQQGLIVDGYASDDEQWSRLNDRFAGYGNDGFSLLLLDDAKFLYAYIKVKDDDIVYRNPRYIPLDSSDQVRIEYTDSNKLHHRLVLLAEGQGGVSVYEVNDDWQTWKNGKHVNAAYAVWRETSTGYDIELRLPVSWLVPEHRLSFSVVNVFDENERYPDTVVSTQVLGSDLLNPILFRSREISSVIEDLQDATSQICVIDKFRRVRAVIGGRQQGNSLCQATDKVNTSLVDKVLAGKEQLIHTNIDDDVLIIAAHPVSKDGETVGAVLVSNSSDQILTRQRDTLFGVLLASLLLFILAVVSLLLFSSRLTYRIERLKNQAASLIDDSGRFIGHVDLTDCRNNDEIGDLSRSFSGLLEKLNSYTCFLETVPGMLRHEILNPVNTISMSLQNLLKHEGSISSIDRDVAVANNAIRQLQTIVSSLTEAANIDEALQQDSVETVDIAALLCEYVNNSRLKHVDRKLQYHGAGRGINVRINDVRMVQLLDKIKDNALDFSAPDSEISFYLDLDHRQHAIIRIKNEGEPISQAQLALLFQGMTSHRTEKTDSPHLGIGLYVAYKISQFHHAQLTIANRRDKQGVVVSLVLPLAI
ncbi:MAG: ATP-binding protein [Gammaproteobacteria bacterium]|nr:ATP-binding protein [Gammaproteobacteria bacterium]